MSAFSLQVALALLTLCFCYIALKLVYHQLYAQNDLKYPPGPPSPSFLFGHFGRMPMKKPWFYYQELGRVYGDMIYFRSLNHHILILNSAEVVNDLLEKHARITSDRPFRNILDRLSGRDKNMGLKPYSESWRQSRRAFHQGFKQDAMFKYEPIQTSKIYEFLRVLASSPSEEELLNYIFTLSQAIVMSSVYGINNISYEKGAPKAAREILDHEEILLLPGGYSIQYIPFIHLLPSLIPFCGLSQITKEVRKTTDELRESCFQVAMEAWKSDNQYSLIGELVLQSMDKNSLAQEVEDIKDMGFTALLAASDTTVSATATFFLCIGLYPHVQAKAQEELHRVLGPGRIPQLSDRKNLPYIEAIYREVMRWHPAVPFSLPHSTTEDIIYKGYLIPEGTVLHPNIWAITHNPDVYPEPEKFIPERHLRENGEVDDSTVYSIVGYGFGRRVCVGRHFADTTLWLTMACLLATMNISMEKGVGDLDIEELYSDLGLCHLTKIPGCKVSPRFSNDELEAVLGLAQEDIQVDIA